MKSFVSKTFIALGLVFILFSLALFVERFIPTTVKNSEAVEQSLVSQPVSITINSIGVNLPVLPASRDNSKFTTTKEGVSYLTDSVLPGLKGNSVFYGHNWPSLLGNLKNTKKGDLIELRYADGQIKFFTVDLIIEMPAKDVSIDSDAEQPILTIYTCSGFLDTKRIIVTANYLGTIL